MANVSMHTVMSPRMPWVSLHALQIPPRTPQPSPRSAVKECYTLNRLAQVHKEPIHHFNPVLVPFTT